MDIKEIFWYFYRKLIAFEKMLSPPKPKVIHHYHDAIEYDTSKVVHVHHHVIIEEELKPKNIWADYYNHLIKGFQ